MRKRRSLFEVFAWCFDGVVGVEKKVKNILQRIKKFLPLQSQTEGRETIEKLAIGLLLDDLKRYQ